MDFFEIAKKWSQAVGISSPSFRNKDHMDILHAILSAEIGDYVIIDKMIEYLEKDANKNKNRRKPIKINNNPNQEDI